MLNWIKKMFKQEEVPFLFVEGKLKVSQEADSCQEVEDDDNNVPMQDLDVELADAGAGHYAVLSTKRWAFSPGEKHDRRVFRLIKRLVEEADLASDSR